MVPLHDAADGQLGNGEGKMEGAQERVKERLVCYPDLGVRRVQDEPLYSEQGPPLIGLRTLS